MAQVLDIYELSPTQQGMLFHTLFAPDTGIYFEQRHCLLHGTLDCDAFMQAWQQVVDRYDVLRTDFHWQEADQPLQVVYDTVALPWIVEDWQALTLAQQTAKLEALLAQDRAQGFQLDQAPLMRCALLQLAPDRYRFIWSYHHLLMDGWCNGVLVKDVLAIYRSIREDSALQLLPPKHYRDYIVWLQQQDQTQAENYWRHILSGFEAPTPLGIDRAAPLQGNSSFGEQQSQLTATLSADLQAFAQRSRLTLNTLFQGVWAIVLSRYSGQSDVLFGITVSGRPPTLAGIESMVGLFINTVPLRSYVPSDASILQWLQELQQDQRDREAYSYSALTDLQSWSDIPSGSPLFESLLVFENYPVSIEAVTQNLDSGFKLQEGQGYEQTNYPLTLVVIPGDEIQLSLRYDTHRVADADAQRLLGHIEQVLRHLVRDPLQSLSQLPLLTKQEQQQLEQLAQGKVVSIPANTIHQQFETQVRQTPDTIALTFSETASAEKTVSLSYQQLNHRANQLAHYLLEQGIGQRIGLCLHRSVDMVVGLLGILKAGCSYVPLDPNYPVNRLQYIVANAELDALITTTDVTFEIGTAALVIALDQLASSIHQCPGHNPLLQTGLDDIAYILYTSGSTGQPKGVPILHRCLSNFLSAMAETLGITADDRLLAITTLAFDIAALEIFLPLVTGAQVVVTSREVAQDGGQLAALLENQRISIMQATPATWRLLLDGNWHSHSSLKVLCGGEALDITLAQQLLARGDEVWNLYGPTETTIWSGALQITPHSLGTGTVPIGCPLANTQFYVLDQQQRQVPIGVPGELYIGGMGLSPGYWQQPELTSERFISSPLAEIEEGIGEGSRGIPVLYRTGDCVRYREDGTLDYLGRLDNQIKLRGFRIELGDIEAALSQHPLVEQAVVVLHDRDNPRLVAYLVLTQQCPQAELVQQLRQWLSQRRPAYMMPAVYIVLEALPLTPNGKVDRRSLPDPEPVTEKAVPPQTTVEVLIAGVWTTVLGCEQVRLNDHFFELGGHSLLATRVIAQLSQVLGVDVPLRSLFEHPILADFVGVVQRTQGRSQPPISSGHPPTLSDAQQRQWLMAQLEPDNIAYTIPTAVRLQGELSITGLQQSLVQVVHRHEPLRTIYPAVNGEALPQVIPASEATAELEIEGIDLRHLDTVKQRSEVRRLTHEQTQQPFNLKQGPLWRSQLLQLSEQEHILLLTFHHMIMDGWSMGLLLQELTTCYQGFQLDQSVMLPPLNITYSDYAHWQKSLDVADQFTYWQGQLRGAAPVLELPIDFPRSAEPSSEGRIYEFRLTQGQTERLKKFSQQNGATLFMTLLAAFKVLLYRYSGVKDLLIGTPVANRQQAELQNLMGLFVNTLVLRTNLAGNPRFIELLAQVRTVALSAYSHQDLPFEQLIEGLEIPRSQSHTPLFQVMFALQDRPAAVALDNLTWSPLSVDTGTAKFDLTLEMQETPGGLVGQIEYRPDLFSADTIHRMAGHLRTLLKALPESSQLRISELPLLLRQEQDQLLVLSQAAQPELSQQDCIQQLFEQQVEQTPDAIALRHGSTTITYEALNQQANQLARHLQSLGVGLETPVGIWATGSPENIVAIVAILKAGGTYVPFDSNYPTERLVWMVEDTQIALLLADHLTEPIAPEIRNKVRVLSLEVLPTQSHATSNLSVEITANQLAYILYTSGSTGQPKGVCTPHRGVTRLVKAPTYITLDRHDVLLQAAPLSFDASTLEIWGALLNGGTLVLLPTSSPSLAELGEIISSHQVTTLWLTAGLFNLMVDEQLDALQSVRQLIAGGDVLSVSHLQKALTHLEHTQIINGYGPTEGTTFTCCHSVSAGDLATCPPIGMPINQTQAYVLDHDFQLVPLGVPGELYIGGAGLARGYLNRPALTAERFIPNPFYDVRQPGNDSFYLYKTGDRVRYRSDGALEYLGRLDQQVKIRGFRIELGEIELALAEHPHVQQAVVRVDGETADRKRLIAYLQSPPLESVALRQFLLSRVPDYMLPAQFICLEVLPLTANGKIDRRALPAPNWERDQFGLPQTDLEQRLAAIWAAALRLKAVGLHDNFFDLGGDSILALQIVSRAAQEGITIGPKQLFQHQTIAELAAVAHLGEVIQISQAPATGPVPLTPIQHWFFEQGLAEPHHFNQSVCLELPLKVDHDALDAAVAAVYQHHDALRLRFTWCDRNWQQQYTDAPPPVIQWTDLAALDRRQQDAAITQQAQILQASLDLQAGPLVVVGGFNLGDVRPSQLLIVIHHLVVDGVSWRILLTDLHQAYQQATVGPTIALRPKTHSYQQWANQLKDRATSPEIAEAGEAWQSLIQSSVLALPQDGLPGDDTTASQQIKATLAVPQTQALLQTVPSVYNTQITPVLLTALMQTLVPWMSQSKILIDLENYGRFSETLDLSRTVGWFTCLYPVCLSLEPGELAEQLRSIKKQLLTIPHQGLSYGLLRYLQNQQSLAISPAISFNYLGQLDLGEFEKAQDFRRIASPAANQSDLNSRVHEIDINCWVEDDRLQMEWTHSPRHQQSQTIDQLAHQFVTNLETLIALCSSRQDVDYTPSDFGLVQLDQTALDAVLAQVSFAGEQEVAP